MLEEQFCEHTNQGMIKLQYIQSEQDESLIYLFEIEQNSKKTHSTRVSLDIVTTQENASMDDLDILICD